MNPKDKNYFMNMSESIYFRFEKALINFEGQKEKKRKFTDSIRVHACVCVFKHVYEIVELILIFV